MEQKSPLPPVSEQAFAAEVPATVVPSASLDSLAQPLAPAQPSALATAQPSAQALVPEPVPLAPDAEPDDDQPDLSLYDWVPVLRKPRKDGWTPQRQRDFICALADTACVFTAARQVGMSAQSAYRLRNSPAGTGFARAWETALSYGARKLVDIAFDRAIHGSDEPVFDRDGNRVGRRMRQNDRLLMFLMRAYMPDRFRYAHRDLKLADEPLPPLEEPLDQALARVSPALPADPRTLMDPERLETALLCADILKGELPHWHRGRGDAEDIREGPMPDEDDDAVLGAWNDEWYEEEDDDEIDTEGFYAGEEE